MNKIIYNIIGMEENAIKLGCVLVPTDYEIAEDIGFIWTQSDDELKDTATFEVIPELLTFNKIEEIVFMGHAKEIKINLI